MVLDAESPLSAIQLLAAASTTLTSSGYERVPAPSGWPANGRVFEDRYGVVAVFIYPSWQELTHDWHEAQGHLVDLMSERLVRSDPKSWEGFLVLLTTDVPGRAAASEVDEIRYDTNRVRKLVSTGDELSSLSDVDRALLPLLPLESPAIDQTSGNLLMRLPDMLKRQGIPTNVTSAIIDAYQENEPVLDRLHAVVSPS